MTRSFKDEQGRPWDLCINVGTLKTVRTQAKIDLLDIENGSLFEDLANDPVKLGDVLWVLCEQQATKQNVTDEEFGRSLAGDSLSDASDALMEEIIDFFPKPRREMLKKLIAKTREVGLEQEKKNLEAFDKMIENITVENLASGNLSTKMQESLESTQTAGPSES